MSSKGRGAPVVDAEFYPTPKWCTLRIIEALEQNENGFGSHAVRSGLWLEPCVGDGAIVRPVVELIPQVVFSTGDIRPIDQPIAALGCHRRESSFDTWDDGEHRQVITNPPFSLAPELIRHFLPRCDWLILLLRASFRLAEWRHNMPDEYKLPQRPEFLASEKCIGPGQFLRDSFVNTNEHGCGWSRKVALTETRATRCPVCGGKIQRSTSDSSEYSWFVWTPERNRVAGLTRVLPDTPLEERKQAP